jgi:hypothetical protein
LVVILIGRLHLSLSNAIDAYTRLVAVIPTQPVRDDEERKINSEAFRAVFLDVLKDAGFEPDSPMIDEAAPKM